MQTPLVRLDDNLSWECRAEAYHAFALRHLADDLTRWGYLEMAYYCERKAAASIFKALQNPQRAA